MENIKTLPPFSIDFPISQPETAASSNEFKHNFSKYFVQSVDTSMDKQQAEINFAKTFNYRISQFKSQYNEFQGKRRLNKQIEYSKEQYLEWKVEVERRSVNIEAKLYKAALKIQKTVRGYLWRMKNLEMLVNLAKNNVKNFEEAHLIASEYCLKWLFPMGMSSIVKVQSFIRMIRVYKVGIKMRRVANNFNERKRYKAANDIQRLWRAHVARKLVAKIKFQEYRRRRLDDIRLNLLWFKFRDFWHRKKFVFKVIREYYKREAEMQDGVWRKRRRRMVSVSIFRPTQPPKDGAPASAGRQTNRPLSAFIDRRPIRQFTPVRQNLLSPNMTPTGPKPPAKTYNLKPGKFTQGEVNQLALPGSPFTRVFQLATPTVDPEKMSSAGPRVPREFRAYQISPTQAMLDKGIPRPMTATNTRKTPKRRDEEDFRLWRRRATPKSVEEPQQELLKRPGRFEKRTIRQQKRDNSVHNPRYQRATDSSAAREDDYNPHETVASTKSVTPIRSRTSILRFTESRQQQISIEVHPAPTPKVTQSVANSITPSGTPSRVRVLSANQRRRHLTCRSSDLDSMFQARDTSILRINPPIFTPTEPITSKFEEAMPGYANMLKLYKQNTQQPKYTISRRNHIKSDIAELTISPLRVRPGTCKSNMK